MGAGRHVVAVFGDTTYNIVPALRATVQVPTVARGPVATFGLALLVVGGGTAVGLTTVPRLGTVLGTLVGGVLLGLLAGRRPLIEGAAAAVVAQLAVLAAAGVPGGGLTGATTVLGSVATTTLALSLAGSAAAGGFGAHLGDDFREGLTAPIGQTDGHEHAVEPPVRDAAGERSRSVAAGSPPEPESESESDAEQETIR